MEKVKLMNMCKIVNSKEEKVLVQERVKSWKGIAFPGGKLEEGESIIKSVEREVYEETGLVVNNLKICGIKDWYDYKEKIRNLIFLFETDTYKGELIPETDEGKVYWVTYEELSKMNLANDFDKLLEVFDNRNINEFVYIDNMNLDDSERWNLKLY